MNFDTEEMDMPTPCQKCGEWFDLNDGRGSKKWFPKTVICESCFEEEEEEIENDEEIEELEEAISDAETTISNSKERLKEITGKDYFTGVDLIFQERNRQISDEGYDSEHDKNYVNNELADAAICYLVDPQHRDTQPFPWPWNDEYWKPTPENRIRELEKAGALIAAEIDRINQQN